MPGGLPMPPGGLPMPDLRAAFGHALRELQTMARPSMLFSKEEVIRLLAPLSGPPRTAVVSLVLVLSLSALRAGLLPTDLGVRSMLTYAYVVLSVAGGRCQDQVARRATRLCWHCEDERDRLRGEHDRRRQDGQRRPPPRTARR